MDNIDTIIEAELPETVETTAAVEQQAEAPENETPEQEEKRLTEAEWLKKERNVVSRREKQLAKERQRNAELAAELEKYRMQATQVAKPQNTPEGRPDPNAKPDGKPWNSYDEYVEAVQDWKLEQFGKKSKELQETAQKTSIDSYREQQFIAQSDQALQNATLEYAKIVPNIEAMIQEHGQTIASFPDNIKRVIREVDPQDVVKAFHAMVTNDTLEDLADMTPIQAAAAIARAASTQIKPSVSRAPAPMAAAKGTSGVTKTLNRMSPQELVDWVNS